MDAIRKYYDRKRRYRRFLLATLSSLSKPVSASEQTCVHTTILKGVCVNCDKAMDNSYGFSFDYLLEGLRYSDSAVSFLKKRRAKTLLRKRKLLLVLDLDNTLIHSRRVTKLSSEDKYLKGKVDSLENRSNGSLFRLKETGFLVKLRPYVRNFLEEASKIFEMHVCTMGSRRYAQEVAELLDPDFKYFKSRITAFEDFKQKERKNLKLVLGQKSNVVIVDDTESVWRGHRENLMTVSRYKYFKQRGVEKSYSEEKTDESESNGSLANILRVLKVVHGLFFDNPASGDVPSYLAKIRGGILTGCTLLLSDVRDFPLIKARAELMGAKCTTVIDSSITHAVASSNTKTEVCRWAEQEKKFLVQPSWIEAAYFLWHRQPEEDYFP